jgi:hypothetical protein
VELTARRRVVLGEGGRPIHHKKGVSRFEPHSPRFLYECLPPTTTYDLDNRGSMMQLNPEYTAVCNLITSTTM